MDVPLTFFWIIQPQTDRQSSVVQDGIFHRQLLDLLSEDSSMSCKCVIDDKIRQGICPFFIVMMYNSGMLYIYWVDAESLSRLCILDTEGSHNCWDNTLGHWRYISIRILTVSIRSVAGSGLGLATLWTIPVILKLTFKLDVGGKPWYKAWNQSCVP